MTRTTLLIPAALIAAALTLSACTDSTEDTSAAPTTTAGATTSVTDTATSDQEEEHSETDVMFAQMMIPHHQQAIEMSEIILAKDGIPADVTALAEEIKAAQGSEIAQLTNWLEQWEEPIEAQDGHGGHEQAAAGDRGVAETAAEQRLSHSVHRRHRVQHAGEQRDPQSGGLRDTGTQRGRSEGSPEHHDWRERERKVLAERAERAVTAA